MADARPQANPTNFEGMSVGVVGAGLTGVLMGIRLKLAGVRDFVIYEQASDVGGTWLRNTYPGLHCDVPSHLYCYTFEPNPHWSLMFSGQAEIRDYFRKCAEKYGLIDHIQFNSRVETAVFDEAAGAWDLTLQDGSEARHRVLISATGGLTEPHIPNVPGLAAFRGEHWHSGHWRHDYDFTNKRVAVVGSAASAVQVVPEVVRRAREVYVFQRTPNWVMPRRNVAYDAATQAAFADPATNSATSHRRTLYRNALMTYQVFRRNPRAVGRLRRMALDNMRTHISDPEMQAALTPNYDPGCKRLLVSDDYYAALAADHVQLIVQGLGQVTETAAVGSDGRVVEVDTIIFSTGYKLGGRADGRPAMHITGRDGLTLSRALSEQPEAYRGVAIPGFPNYFTINGINGSIAYTSLIGSAEVHADYIVKRIRDIAELDLRSIEVRLEVTRRYNDLIQPELQTMSWAGPCQSFYKDATGRILSFYPGTVGRMRREFRRLGLDDYLVDRRYSLEAVSSAKTGACRGVDDGP